MLINREFNLPNPWSKKEKEGKNKKKKGNDVLAMDPTCIISKQVGSLMKTKRELGRLDSINKSKP